MNLTHVYGCVPAGEPAHVHPDQHAMAAMIPSLGTDSGNELLYFANDGGVYRTLNGFSGMSGNCSALNQFDDLNQNLGSLTQFIRFSQHPSDRNTLLGARREMDLPPPMRRVRILPGSTSWAPMAPIRRSIRLAPRTGMRRTRTCRRAAWEFNSAAAE